MSIVGVVGSRTFKDYLLLSKELDKISITKIVSGGAMGADSLAIQYAIYKGLPYIIYPANWDLHGKKAGFIRNIEIVSNSDEIIAFWDGVSKGTKSTIDIANKQGKKVTIIS